MTKSRQAGQPIYRIPTFGLYGNVAQPSAAGYAHIEKISERAPVYGWEIGSHRHADLAQFIVVTEGGGELDLEGARHPIAPPWIVWLPSGVVHGFKFKTDTVGLVLTVSVDIVADAIRSGPDFERLATVAGEPRCGELLSAREIGIDVAGLMQGIVREHGLPRSGVNTAVSASLVLLLVALLRLRTLASLDRHLGKAQASEFRKFREFIERHFREQQSVADIAAHLNITPHRLHSITVKAVGKGPLAIQHDRILLECQRELLYTGKAIAEIAFDCGFEDPAHFSRFFAKRAGGPPRDYRKRLKR
ncbi:MAG: helix-turn-helix domain-containing protein [Hyphomicrobiaceae bacterium]|nr:MAG: helix-turn-helix domain-containing protein [Hyphomicrobiaceae bacterium]